MPRYDLSAEEAIEVLAGGTLVRVAFHDGEAPYLIPLGYVWLDSALFGVAELGRKTRMAESNPTVAFQVDTSAETGVFEWESATGEGTFRVVEGDVEKQQVLAALQPVIAQAPDWWQREQAPRMAAGSLLVWRITPTRISGCRYAPPAD